MDNTFFYWDDIMAEYDEGFKAEMEMEFERFPACEEEDEYYDLADIDYEGWD